MYAWHAVITKVAKKNKGAVVKNRKGPEEVLVPFTLGTLVEVDLDEKVFGADQHDTSWVEPHEREYVLVGTEVELITEANTFPTDASQILSANFRFALDIVKGGAKGPVTRGTVVIIYHDFHTDQFRGDSGSAFAEAVYNYSALTLGKPVLKINASNTYPALISELTNIAAKQCDQFFVDTILIATHGTAGQLWLGDPHSDRTQDVMARRVSGKHFVEPQAFGSKLLELFGKGLGIGIYSCDFAGDEDGRKAAVELRVASDARAVYAGIGTVFLACNKTGRPTVSCNQAQVVYRPETIEILSGNQIPVFDL